MIARNHDPAISKALLRTQFMYYPVTGEKKPKRGHDGYLRVKLRGKTYPVTALIWVYMFDRWPEGVIDHINRNRSDNRLENLQDVSVRQNIEMSVHPKKGWKERSNLYP